MGTSMEPDVVEGHDLKHAILSGLAAAAAAAILTGTAFAGGVTGGGSTLIYPVMAKWADSYQRATGVSVNYQSIGSGGGIKQVEAGTVTFGATDKPLSDEELDRNGLVQFPLVMGGIVPIVNIDGVKPGELVLDGKTLAGIFMGTITSWDDGAIRALNPTLALPTIPIAVVHRSDGSGTTFNFTDYLGKQVAAWQDTVGSETAVEWPVGIGAKGSEGIANTVRQTAGSIGYLEYAYATQNSLSYTRMINAAGKAVPPSLESFAAVASNADFAGTGNFNQIITNQPGEAAWQIAATTRVLIRARPDDPAAAAEALKFFDWAYREGREQAIALDYVPLPDNLVRLIEGSWDGITAGGKPVLAAR